MVPRTESPRDRKPLRGKLLFSSCNRGRPSVRGAAFGLASRPRELPGRAPWSACRPNVLVSRGQREDVTTSVRGLPGSNAVLYNSSAR